MTSDGVSLLCRSHPPAPWYRRVWFWLRRPKLSPESLETIEIDLERVGMGIKLEPEDLEACDAAMRLEQAKEDYTIATAGNSIVTLIGAGTYTIRIPPGYAAHLRNTGEVILEKVVNDNEIEKEIQAKGLNAPRVTLEQIEARIALECYTTGECFSVWSDRGQWKEEKIRLLNELELVTVCILVLQNGYKVTGESACVSRENFNAELGRKIARQKAVEKIWALEGYLLKEHEYAPAG